MELAIDTASVVVRGSFNPAIFSPAWLFGQGLIGGEELAAAHVDVISGDLAAFRCGWLACHVTKQVMQFSTDDETEFERTRDAAVGALRALSHTPIGAVGINRDVHFEVGSVERWHAIGDHITPKEVWSDVLPLAGMRSVTMWGVRSDQYGGRVQVAVEPSQRVPRAVYVQHNDHFLLASVSHQPTSRNDVPVWDGDEMDAYTESSEKIPIALEVLANEWEPSMSRAEAAIRLLAGLGGAS